MSSKATRGMGRKKLRKRLLEFNRFLSFIHTQANGKFLFAENVYTVLFKSNESEMREFRSLSSRTFVEISLENSSVFSRCSRKFERLSAMF